MTTAKPSDPPSGQPNETRERILRAALQAFSEKGYAGASTLMIATRAKVSKRDLYALFPSKEAMLVACITSRTLRMGMPEGLPEPVSREMLASTLEAFGANFLLEALDPDVIGTFRLAISEAVHSPEIAKRLEEARATVRAILQACFVRAQTRGLLPAGDVSAMVRTYVALLDEGLTLDLLLGILPQPDRATILRQAARAATDFLLIYR